MGFATPLNVALAVELTRASARHKQFPNLEDQQRTAPPSVYGVYRKFGAVQGSSVNDERVFSLCKKLQDRKPAIKGRAMESWVLLTANAALVDWTLVRRPARPHPHVRGAIGSDAQHAQK